MMTRAAVAGGSAVAGALDIFHDTNQLGLPLAVGELPEDGEEVVGAGRVPHRVHLHMQIPMYVDNIYIHVAHTGVYQVIV